MSDLCPPGTARGRMDEILDNMDSLDYLGLYLGIACGFLTL